jgi:hypothetical protein
MALAVQIAGQEKLKTYTPRSDISIWINGFPRLIWEVCSDPSHQKDELRMLVCGSSVVKLANLILKDEHQPPNFVLVSIYQTATEATFYLLYQDGNKVSHWLSSNYLID